MFVKAISLKDVKAGDVVLLVGETQWQTVEEDAYSRNPTDPFKVVKFQGRGALISSPDTSVLVRRRPWPEGKTEGQMRNSIVAAAAGFLIDPSDENVAKLLEASEAYELGKPLEKNEE